MSKNMSQAIDVKQWLSDNQLLDVHQIFVKRDISIEELLEFELSDIQLISFIHFCSIQYQYIQPQLNRDFANEIGLDTLQKNRFIKGIRKLKSISNNEESKNGIDSIQNNYYAETTKLIEQLQTSFNTVDESIKSCQNQVNQKFDQLFEKLKIQQTKILKDIEENGKSKKDEIAKELQLMIDARIEMQSLDYKQIKQFKSMVACSTNYKINFKYNESAQNNLLSSMHIQSYGLPPGCVLVIDQNNITSNSIKVEENEKYKSDVINVFILLMKYI